MFQNNLIAGASGQGGFYPTEIEQSLRFNDNDSAYLSRTPAGAGNRKTWTWSGWVKRGNLVTAGGTLFAAGPSSNTQFFTMLFSYSTDYDKISIFNYVGATSLELKTNALYRDPSAWYHVVLAIDTTQATSSDRAKLYVNGEQVTSFSSSAYPALNADTEVNAAQAHSVGSSLFAARSNYFDGYMAEVNLIDGTALDPTSFGETKSGIWVPKAYSGAYGTNGFYLSFADSAAIGDDLSGNGNDWTANNLVATDVLLDSPTQNWCVLNPLTNSGGTFTEGNLQYVGPSSGRKILGTTGVSTGKWYWEVAILNAPESRSSTSQYNTFGFSLASSVGVTTFSGDSEALAFADSGYYRNFTGSWTDGGTAIASGDVLACAVDLDANTFAFKKNNVDVVTGSIDSVADGKILTPHQASYNGSFGKMFCNFGQDSSFAGNKTAQGNTDANGVGDFYYAPPSGFLALCTANLPDPVIDPAQDDVPADYFNTVLWTGDNANPRSITGVGFQPDWAWIKCRTNAAEHRLHDAVRGSEKLLYSSTNDAELATDASGTINSFDADGFTLGGSSSVSNVNLSPRTYVAWNWLAGNGTASNTDGSITSTVSVNQKAGFSVVSYTGNGTAGATVGHSLGAAPDVLLVKRRSAANDWQVYHSANTSAPETDYLILNQTLATIDTAATWNDTAPTSSVFTVGNGTGVNNSSDTYIAYCFAEVEGYSKFGSYTGNGSTDGPFVYCGFRPAFFLYKRTDTTASWVILDAERNTSNVVTNLLSPNLSQAETSFNFVDFCSNGVKIRNNFTADNGSGGTFIFMAFAESPFKYANAR